MKTALIGLEETSGEDMQTWPWPKNQAQWAEYGRQLKNFSRLLFLPPLPFISAALSGQTRLETSLPGLQEEFESACQGAPNFSALLFTDLKKVEELAPLTYNEASLARPQIIGLGISNCWLSSRWRGHLCAQRLRGWTRLKPAQRRLELNLLGQVLLLLFALALALAWIGGLDTIGWLLILLLYPLNRSFLRLVAARQPEQMPAALAFCLLRPLAWLAGLLYWKK